MTAKGVFISIDGPGGAGKSTIAALVAGQLGGRGLPVRATTEPSRTTLGNLIRASTDTYRRMALACLVLQRIDGVSWETIWQLNAGTDAPDLAVILNAEPAVLAARLTQRGGAHSRFERFPDDRAAEHDLFQDTPIRLAQPGWNVCLVDTTREPAAEVATKVTNRILDL